MEFSIIKNELDEEFIQGIDESGLVHGIPKDPANSDYQAYLAWLAEQDEVTE